MGNEKRPPSLAIAVAAVLLVAPACVLRGPADVRREVAAATGAEYEKEFGLTLGRVSMGLARWGLKLANAGEDDDLPVSLKGVRKLQVGVYQVKQGTWTDAPVRLDPRALSEWEPIVRIRDDGEDVLVTVRVKHESVRGMLVVASDRDELVIVRLEGKLDRLLDEALRYGLDEADRADVYEPAREQMHAEMATWQR